MKAFARDMLPFMFLMLVFALVFALVLLVGGCNPQPSASQTRDCQARDGHMQQTGAGGWACLPNQRTWN